MVIIFVSLVAVGQQIKRAPLGLGVEQDLGSLTTVGSDDYQFTYRSLSVFGHPNEFSAFLLAYFFMILGAFLNKTDGRGLEGVALVSIALGIFSSGTRSIILIILVLLPFFFLVLKRSGQKFYFPKISLRIKFASIIVFTIIGLNIIPRFVNMIYTFDEYGGMSTRISLIKSAMDIFHQYPFWGVGMGMVPYYKFMYYHPADIQVAQVLSYFPSPVHNGLLFIIEESGLLGLIPYILLLWVASRRLVFRLLSDKQTFVTWGILFGIIASLINSLVQVQYLSIIQLLILILLGEVYTSPKKAERSLLN